MTANMDTGFVVHRYPVRKSFFDQPEEDRWMSWRFTMKVYEEFMPMHLKLIRSAIDQLTDGIKFDRLPVLPSSRS